jgi:hypothetical protein
MLLTMSEPMLIPGLVTPASADSTPDSSAPSTPDGMSAGNSTSKLNSTERAYGRVHLGLDEVFDILDEAARVPGCVCLVVRVDELGQQRNVAPVPLEHFDPAALVRRYGSGEFKVRITQPGRRGAIRAFKFLIDSPTDLPNRQTSFPPAATGATTPVAASLNGDAAQPQNLFGHAMQMMTTMMSQQQSMAQAAMTQQTTLLTTMLAQKQEPRGMGELEAVLKLAERIARRDNSGGEEGGGIMQQILAGVVQGLSRPAAAPAPIMQRRMVMRQPAAAPAQIGRVAPLPAVPATPATPIAPAAPTIPTPETLSPTAASDEPQLPAATPAPAALGAADLPEAPELATEVGLALMKLAPAEALLLQMLRDGADADRLADVIAATLGDDDLELILERCKPGEMAAIVLAHVPDMRPHSNVIAEVERSLRDLTDDTSTGEQEQDDS